MKNIMGAFNWLLKVIGFSVIYLLADFLGLFKLVSKKIDNIFYYAYDFEKFGSMAIFWRWAMLLSTVYVITMLLTKAINSVMDDINA